MDSRYKETRHGRWGDRFVGKNFFLGSSLFAGRSLAGAAGRAAEGGGGSPGSVKPGGWLDRGHSALLDD